VFWTWRYMKHCTYISLCAVLRDRLLYRLFVIAVCPCLKNKLILLLFKYFEWVNQTLKSNSVNRLTVVDTSQLANYSKGVVGHGRSEYTMYYFFRKRL